LRNTSLNLLYYLLIFITYLLIFFYFVPFSVRTDIQDYVDLDEPSAGVVPSGVRGRGRGAGRGAKGGLGGAKGGRGAKGGLGGHRGAIYRGQASTRKAGTVRGGGAIADARKKVSHR
jgi:hypothetical protein